MTSSRSDRDRAVLSCPNAASPNSALLDTPLPDSALPDSALLDAAVLDTAMQSALAAALDGPRGANPLVGAAVIAADGRIVTGRHLGAGTPHAEVDAITRARAAGIDLTRSTLVVTLEPCNHTGRTGPCTGAILDAGIPHVVHAIDDPNPQAAGGAALLRARGVHVESGVRAAEATALNDRWFRAYREGRPFVTLKLAQSLDGKVAAADGTSRWITSAASRAHAHTVRTRVDGILVGTGTVRADDPQLTARGADGALLDRQPRPVVLGSTPLSPESHLARNPRTLHLGAGDDAGDEAPTPLPDHLRTAAAEGISHLLVEGGPTVSGAFLAADLVDEIHLYTAPILLGDGLPAVRGLGATTLLEAHRFVLDAADSTSSNPAVLGPDVLTRLVPAPAPSPDLPSTSTPEI
ncbi:bifunctional diaminohydroxyphosphoribosylaminopyrimidine deaminase/5-amino-6-(5-phosphoribosylamino)uracil reductase RibD [Brevibacterium samyangense]|uniref:Riboflavin biosynthesis protein RibD n=1 Tax=Brevibacterium samyangense TaxID=366888 RepID=A0ABN2TJP6_9MICO